MKGDSGYGAKYWYFSPEYAFTFDQNTHYASLANFYTVYDLRNLKPEQTRLYLLCYAWVLYR